MQLSKKGGGDLADLPLDEFGDPGGANTLRRRRKLQRSC